jgi:putative DNA-invertase from lambdoid prophage Rac
MRKRPAGRAESKDARATTKRGAFWRSKKAAPRGKRCGIYARVSTADQRSLRQQRYALVQYAEHRGWTIQCSASDVASGAKTRPNREKVLAMARRGELDAIVVWKLDRWGRSVADLVLTLADLSAAGVAFVSLTEALDLTTSSGRALAGMLAVFAEFERELIRERVIAGIANARRHGKKFGRPATARVQKHTIRKLRAQGQTNAAIAKRLKIGESSVRRILAA